MFSKAAIFSLLSTSLVAALPGHGGAWPETTCSTIYSTSYWTTNVKVPVPQEKTVWIPQTKVVNGSMISTSLITHATGVVKQVPSCITTSYPMTVWVTKEITTMVPSTVSETCTETKVVTVPTCSTIVTSRAQVETCTEWSTSCMTSSSVCSTVSCTSCDGTASWAAGPTAPPAPVAPTAAPHKPRF